MPLFQWTKNYSVGVTTMDKHHQKLFDILNTLHDAMLEGKGKELVTDTIQELLDYTKYHFGEEEKLMERTNYSGLGEQKAAHAKFISEIEEYQKKADQGMEAFLSSGMSIFLTDWLKNHIGKIDKKYQFHMNEHGII